jgi:membrane protein YdbS with pleckstrin-like domain
MLVSEKALLRASQWCYQGIWSVITKYLIVPTAAPQLVGADDVQIQSFRPAEGFLKYLKFYFWFGLVAADVLLFVLWIILLIYAPVWVSVILTPIIWFIMIVPDVIAYVAIHLRYDSTWYVLSDRSMRIRRGIWKIHETTITYENIQNVSVSQGPLQRYFGISDVRVETAGGGSVDGTGMTGHQGNLEGIDNAEEVRRLIMAKWQQSRSAGLGDEDNRQPNSNLGQSIAFSERQLVLLGQIRDLAKALVR